MSDNVLILGAGFSYDAGVPLLAGFVERMWECAIRGKCNGEQLQNPDIEIFRKAIEIRDELNGYHGRAMFDDRNLEDILSILSFEALNGSKKGKAKLTAINKAIARTIELSCSVKHSGATQAEVNTNIIKDGPNVYRDFWRALFLWFSKGNALPAIITFNYDLVLERSLLQVFTNDFYSTNEHKLPFDNFHVMCHVESLQNLFYHVQKVPYATDVNRSQYRNTLMRKDKDSLKGEAVEIEILKLHGSLNFPQPKKAAESLSYNIVDPVPDPYILPPIFNKMSSNSQETMWEFALQHLRKAKNIIIVGYSLPQTDIYMQYFLKAGVGPNKDLNKIFVFDPVLYDEQKVDQARAMNERYASCFAEQLRNRICFAPDSYAKEQISLDFLRHNPLGTTKHFVGQISMKPTSVLF